MYLGIHMGLKLKHSCATIQLWKDRSQGTQQDHCRSSPHSGTIGESSLR